MFQIEKKKQPQLFTSLRSIVEINFIFVNRGIFIARINHGFSLKFQDFCKCEKDVVYFVYCKMVKKTVTVVR